MLSSIIPKQTDDVKETPCPTYKTELFEIAVGSLSEIVLKDFGIYAIGRSSPIVKGYSL